MDVENGSPRQSAPVAGRVDGRRGSRHGRALAAGAALVLAAGVPRCPLDGAGPAAGAEPRESLRPSVATGAPARTPDPPAGAEPPERDAPVAGGAPPPELRAVAEQVERFLPAHARLDRLALPPHHVVLGGHVPDFDGVVDLLESLARIPGIEEPELRRAAASERGVEFGVVLAAPPPARAAAGRDDPEPPPAPAYASLPVRRALFRWLFPPPT